MAERSTHRPSWLAHIRQVLMACAVMGAFTAGLGPAPVQARPVASPEPVRLEFVDQLGGVTYAVDGVGDMVVSGAGPRVRVHRFDAAGRTTLLGRSPVLPGIVAELALGRGYVLAGLREGGVHLLALEEPTRPRVVGPLVRGIAHSSVEGGRTLAVLSGGRVAVVAAKSRLFAFDLGDPSRPVAAPPLEMGAPVRGIAAEGPDLYAAVDVGLLRRLRFDAGAGSGRVIEEGRFPGAREHVRLLDVRHGHMLFVGGSSAIVGLGALDGSGFDSFRTRARVLTQARGSITEAGIWWGTRGSEALHFHRRSAGSANVEGASWRGVRPGQHATIHDVKQVGEHLLVAAGAGGVLRYRLSATAEPALDGRIFDPLAVVADVAPAPRGAIAATPFGWRSLRVAGGMHDDGGGDIGAPVTAVAAGGSRALALGSTWRERSGPMDAWGEIGLVQVLHTSNDGPPTVERTIERAREGRPVSALAVGDRGFVATDRGFLVEYDLAPHGPPHAVSRHGAFEPFTDLAWGGDLAIAAYRRGTAAGLRPIPVDAAPRRDRGAAVDLVLTGGAAMPPAEAVGLHGRLALFADGLRLLALEQGPGEGWRPTGQLDLPAAAPVALRFTFQNPVLRGYPQQNRFGLDIATSHHRAWVAHGQAGIRVIDTRLPALLDEVAMFDTPGGAQSVALAGDRVWVADGEGGVLLLRRTGFAHGERAWLPWAARGKGMRR